MMIALEQLYTGLRVMFAEFVNAGWRILYSPPPNTTISNDLPGESCGYLNDYKRQLLGEPKALFFSGNVAYANRIRSFITPNGRIPDHRRRQAKTFLLRTGFFCMVPQKYRLALGVRMGIRTTGGILRKSLSPAFLVIVFSLIFPAFPPGTATAADVRLSSKTYGLSFERQLAGGQKDRYAPLYEYLSADAANLGGKPLSLHFYGWGRADLGDQTGTGKTSGEIGSLYLEYQHPEGNAQGKLGRFFLTEGAAMDTIDGAFVKATTPVGLGVSLYGGVPVEYSILENAQGGTLSTAAGSSSSSPDSPRSVPRT